MGAVVRKYRNGLVLFQKCFSGVAEDLELGDVFVDDRVVLLCAVQDHALVQEADSRRERDGFAGANDVSSSGHWRGADAAFGDLQAQGGSCPAGQLLPGGYAGPVWLDIGGIIPGLRVIQARDEPRQPDLTHARPHSSTSHESILPTILTGLQETRPSGPLPPVS